MGAVPVATSLVLASLAFRRLKGRGDERSRAIVVGAGLGGLAAAMRLGAKGYRVTVLDRLAGKKVHGR